MRKRKRKQIYLQLCNETKSEEGKEDVFIPFWVIPRRLSSNCRRFGTHYLFHLHRQVNEVYFIHLPTKMEPIVSSEMSAIRTQTPGNYPKRNKLHLEQGESLKTRKMYLACETTVSHSCVLNIYANLNVILSSGKLLPNTWLWWWTHSNPSKHPWLFANRHV